MGSNSVGQVGVVDKSPSPCNKYSPILIEDLMEESPVEVECGRNHTLLMTASGWVFAWGSNNHGQCGAKHSDTMVSVDLVVH